MRTSKPLNNTVYEYVKQNKRKAIEFKDKMMDDIGGFVNP